MKIVIKRIEIIRPFYALVGIRVNNANFTHPDGQNA